MYSKEEHPFLNLSSKPRFGQKKNSKLVTSAAAAKSSTAERSQKKQQKVFTGEDLIATSTSGAMTSQELLSRLWARKNTENQGDDSFLGNLPTSEHSDILSDLRNFVAFQAAKDGEATTSELLTKFNGEKHFTSVLFRSMVRQLCHFHRTATGDGVWTLKPEFR